MKFVAQALCATLWPEETSHGAHTVVRARIDEETKNEAAAVLATIGLTVSDAFRLMMVRIAKEKALPFDPLIPDEETVSAMKDARAGRLKTVGSVDKLLADLNATAPSRKTAA